MISQIDIDAWDFYDSGQLDDYQKAASSTAIYKSEHLKLVR